MGGGDITLSNSDQRSDLQARFDSYCKKVLRNAARNIKKKKHRINDSEILYSSLDDISGQQDNYFDGVYTFNVLGQAIVVYSESIVNTLLSLAEPDRNIILMAYFLEMTDQRISENIDVPLSTVQYRRNKLLKEMKSYLEKAGQIID